MRRHSLRKRIAGAFVLLAFVLCTFFSFTGRYAVEVAEKQLVNDRLEQAATKLIDEYQRHMLPSTQEDNFYVNDEIPERFRHLHPGVHEVRVNGGETTVCIRRVGNDTFAVADDTSDFAITEKLIYVALSVGFVTSLLLAIVLGVGAAELIVAPLTALARAIERNDPPATLPALDRRNEIGTLARAFARRTEQLQGFLADEKLFTGDVSHELRTPLTIILGAAELLKVQLADMPQQLVVAERIRRVAAEASERVSALLLLSQSPQMLGSASLSLTHLVEREIERCRQLLGDKPVTLRFDGDADEVWIQARAELAGVAVGNLLRNACQYTEQGVVRVALSPSALVIEDNGPGLPPNVHARLFERFVRGSNETHVGSGLGLAIVKRVADHLGWQILHENLPQGGSRFTLRFPVNGSSRADNGGMLPAPRDS